jgi:hypothetical protein
MSDTPRTDANDLGWQFNEQHGDFDSLSDNPMPWLDFAKMLERKLDAVTEQRDEVRADLEFRRGLFQLQEQQMDSLREQRDRLADLVKQFIAILDITEESDSGRLFHPTNITSCRAGDLQKIGGLVEAFLKTLKLWKEQ